MSDDRAPLTAEQIADMRRHYGRDVSALLAEIERQRQEIERLEGEQWTAVKQRFATWQDGDEHDRQRAEALRLRDAPAG